MYKINIWVQTLQRSPVIPVCTVWRGWWRRPWLTSNLPRPPLESGGLSPDYRRVRVWYCGPRYFDQPRCFIRLAQLWSANITTNWEYALLACIDYGEIVIMEARNRSKIGCVLYIFILLSMKLTWVQGGASCQRLLPPLQSEARLCFCAAVIIRYWYKIGPDTAPRETRRWIRDIFFLRN